MEAWKKISEELHLNAGEDNGAALLRASTRGDRVIWSIVAFLVLLSLLAVYSSTGTLAYRQNQGNTWYYLFRQVSFIIVGVGIIYFTHKVDYRFFSRVALWLYIASIPLLLYTLIFGANLNDASRWIKLPLINLTFQTSDFARLALFMYLARQLSRKQKIIHDFRKGFLPLVMPIVLTCILIAPANLSTAVLTAATGMLLLFLGRASMRHIAIMVAVAAIPVVLLVMAALLSYRAPVEGGAEAATSDAEVMQSVRQTGRVGTWMHRIQDFAFARGDAAPYQLQQAKIAIAKGGWIGLGPGNSQQRNFLPHPYSDFIYSIIVEEYGLLGGGFLILLYLVFMYRCILLLRKAPRAFGAFLALALSMTLVIQALVNMAVNVGLFPITGVTLPLVSMGGTSFLFTCFAIGIILSVARQVELLEGQGREAVPENVSPEMPEATHE